jgi:predicted MFS family arabinose efflux permease
VDLPHDVLPTELSNVHNFSPQSVGVCLLALQIAAVAGVWLMRVGERTTLAHSLRGLFILTMLLLTIVTVLALMVKPESGISAGIVLAVVTVMAVIDFRQPVRR